MNTRPVLITVIVVGTIAAVALIYALTLSICAVRGITPPENLLSALKDVGLVALGALGSMLARTASGDAPAAVTVTNSPEDPVNTAETTK